MQKADELPAKKIKQNMSEEKSAMKKLSVKAIAVKPVKKIKITTKTTPLRVRADPYQQSRGSCSITHGNHSTYVSRNRAMIPDRVFAR